MAGEAPGNQHGIHTIDTAFQRDHFDAAYLLVEDGRGAFVDCGTNHSIPNLLAALDAAGLGPADVDWLLVTHVHLDHAGGAGALMARLPNARLVVHPRGARHMVDPSKLIAGATAVYGEEEMTRSYGPGSWPLPRSRVVGLPKVRDIPSAFKTGRRLSQDTPGHARNHYCVWDARAAAGSPRHLRLSYRELMANWAVRDSHLIPVQFEPEALKHHFPLMSHQPEWMYLTHYGRVGDMPAAGARLHEQIAPWC